MFQAVGGVCCVDCAYSSFKALLRDFVRFIFDPFSPSPSRRLRQVVESSLDGPLHILLTLPVLVACVLSGPSSGGQSLRK